MSGNSLSVLEHALLHAPAQKRLALDLGLSEGELSKQLATLRRCGPLLDQLGLELVSARTHEALKVLLKESL